MTKPILPPAALRHWRTWYTTTHWRRRRQLQLNAHPLCLMCLARGVVTPATIADHIESHRGNWNAFLMGALQSLCKSCHDSSKRRIVLDGCSSEIDDDGWPTDPRHPTNARPR
jgi:hypothetical protein